MSDKPVKYSEHAIIRKFERDITDDQIIDTINNPDYTITSIDGRKIAVKKTGNREIHVVYKDSKMHINVITVY